LRDFPRTKKFDCIAQNTFHKTSAKHRKSPQNTAKQSQNAFCEITSQNTAQLLQTARKPLENVTKRSQYSRNTYCVLRAFGVFSQNTLDLCRESTQYTQYTHIRVNYGGGSRTRRGSRSRSVDVFQKQCVCGVFAVFCGVLRCLFVCVFLTFLTKQPKQTAQNRPKKVYTKRTKRITKYALCNTNTAQYGDVQRSLTQKMSTKNIHKTRPKHCKILANSK